VEYRFAPWLFLLISAALPACAHVAPYERGQLAHPSMQMDGESDPAEAHVQAVHEGATGGRLGAASGCGCN
jgi:hypothetical protein